MPCVTGIVGVYRYSSPRMFGDPLVDREKTDKLESDGSQVINTLFLLEEGFRCMVRSLPLSLDAVFW